MGKIKFKIFIGGVLVFLAVLGFQTFKKFKEINALENKANLLKKNLEKLREENIKIEEEIEYFKEPQNLEKEARKRFSLRKPGEKVIIITK